MTPEARPLPAVKKRVKKGVNPDQFLQIMKRLDDIDQEIKEEEKVFEARTKSLELEKQYLWDQLQPK